MKLALLTCLLLAAGAASAQPTFPRIDPGVQAARDSDRRTILLQEHAEETKVLQAAEKALTSAEPGEKGALTTTVERHRKNLAALDAEIRRAGGAASSSVAPAVAVAGPVRLKAASAAPAAVTTDAPVAYWDVHRRREPQAQPSDAAAATTEAAPYWDVFRRTDTQP